MWTDWILPIIVIIVIILTLVLCLVFGGVTSNPPPKPAPRPDVITAPRVVATGPWLFTIYNDNDNDEIAIPSIIISSGSSAGYVPQLIPAKGSYLLNTYANATSVGYSQDRTFSVYFQSNNGDGLTSNDTNLDFTTPALDQILNALSMQSATLYLLASVGDWVPVNGYEYDNLQYAFGYPALPVQGNSNLTTGPTNRITTTSFPNTTPFTIEQDQYLFAFSFDYGALSPTVLPGIQLQFVFLDPSEPDYPQPPVSPSTAQYINVKLPTNPHAILGQPSRLYYILRGASVSISDTDKSICIWSSTDNGSPLIPFALNSGTPSVIGQQYFTLGAYQNGSIFSSEGDANPPGYPTLQYLSTSSGSWLDKP